MADLIRDIDTVVIVLMENRSFDHILGYLGLPPFNLPLRGFRKARTTRDMPTPIRVRLTPHSQWKDSICRTIPRTSGSG